jgi:hypothetical protein
MKNVFVSILLLLTGCCPIGAGAQKMLVFERANRAKTTKIYAGEQIKFSLKGDENYWYTRTIRDIFPESKTLLLDEYSVHVDSIAAIKMPKGGLARICGTALLSFGATIPLALGGALLYRDKEVKYGPWLIASGVCLASSYVILKPHKRKLGKKYRLRILEIKFPDPLIAPPPVRQ